MFQNSIKHLKNVPLFARVADAELEKIAARMKELHCQKGEVIISEGEVGDCLYIIRSGKVKVVANSENGGDEIILSYLADGDYFGEMALLTGEPRSATVIAESEVELWQLDKSDFDTLLMNNPSITLSLSHMLSHRLKLANKARQLSERYYKQKLTPRGSLKEVGIIKLLKFAEENSLSGKIYLNRQGEQAVFEFKKGQLQHLSYGDRDEDRAMDELLLWEDGEFIIDPTFFSISQLTDIKGEQEKPEQVLQEDLTVSVFEKFLLEKFREIIRFAGSRTLQSAIKRSVHKFSAFFQVAVDFDLQAEPELLVKIHCSSLTDQHMLYLAVLLRDILHALELDTVGLEFWDMRSQEEQTNEMLEKELFFEYFDQAVDFIG